MPLPTTPEAKRLFVERLSRAIQLGDVPMPIPVTSPILSEPVKRDGRIVAVEIKDIEWINPTWMERSP